MHTDDIHEHIPGKIQWREEEEENKPDELAGAELDSFMDGKKMSLILSRQCS